jgi:hypothetical protein
MELLQKLRIKTDEPLWLVNAPDDVLPLFASLEIKTKLGKQKPVRQLLVFAYNSADLMQYLPVMADYVGHETLLWICWPKKTGAYKSDLVQMAAWNVVFDAGYRGQTSVSIDDNWTGLRVTNAPPKKPSTYALPIEERKDEGIDYVHRTVQLPPDAQAEVEKHAGLADYFYAQSFTCKKEHVMAIHDAKKEDTRRRRIEKMIEMLQQKMHAKAAPKK